jgi:predicted nucleotidyltransferase
MLETSIKELNDTIKLLIISMGNFAKEPITNQVFDQTATSTVATKIIEEISLDDLKKETTSPEHLRVELQEICSSKIVKDRSLKDQIKAIIAQYDGATHLAKVPDANLAELRTKLMGLK